MNYFLSCAIGGCEEDYSYIFYLILLAVIIISLIVFIVFKLKKKK